MRHSAGRILTTHVGSLPRPQEVVDQLVAQDEGRSCDTRDFDAVMTRAVAGVVHEQLEAGVDVPSDGEMSKISYATYIRHRFTGFEIGEAPRMSPRDLDDFPEFKTRLVKMGAAGKYLRPLCCGPIAVRDSAPLARDIANLKAALAAQGVAEGFMNAAAPGVIAVFQHNRYYPTQEAYLAALAEAMRHEYRTIVAAGLVLQIDAPDLALGRHLRFRDADEAEFLRNAALQVEALNHALEGIAPDRVRVHLCWGNYEGPHHHDIGLEKIVGLVLRIRAQAILFEAANPRHAHEWRVWEATKIPDDRILVPGVLDSVSNFIEHPELVAERIQRYADIVGRERVMAGADCGFGTFAAFGAVHPPIAYAKLQAMAEGAAIASRRLWGRALPAC
jgi:5-methyltetrahydropteroyltriglutamate--homocysteine methyltransferase